MRLLSTRELADALGTSESSLKRWIDAGRIAASRTEGGHRRVRLDEALRFVRASRAPIVRPELLDLPEIVADRARGERLLAYLVDGDARAARGFVAARYLDGARVAELADGPIRDAMHGLGELWHHDEAGVFIEHRGTDACVQAVSQLRGMVRPAGADAPFAVGGAPSGDPYILPSVLACLTLAEAGMNAINLGPDTPIAAFDAAIAVHRPQLVWLSISTALGRRDAASLASWLDTLPRAVEVIVGGQQAYSLDPLPARARRAASMVQLSELAGALDLG